MIFMIKVILCSHCGQGGPVVDKAGLSATPAPNSQASATPATPFRSPWHSKEGPQISISEIGISEMADSENSPTLSSETLVPTSAISSREGVAHNALLFIWMHMLFSIMICCIAYDVCGSK